MFDKDIFSSDEMIGSAELDFSDVAKFSQTENLRQGTRVSRHENNEDIQVLKRIKYGDQTKDQLEVQMMNKDKHGVGI